jgi:hypothetical protein
MTASPEKITAYVQSVLNQGNDPRLCKKGLAGLLGVDVAVIEAEIERLGAPRVVSAEQVAQERLEQDRRARRSAGFRRYSHEEE